MSETMAREGRALDPFTVIADAYAPVSDELNVELRVEMGRFPDALDGVLFRNGPGSLEMGPDHYRHPFDGDGMVVRFEFTAGRVHYRNRFIATEERTAELRAGRMLFRAFGTNLPGGFRRNGLRMRFKNAANTSVQWHGRRLLALWEGGLPHALDDKTLATHGRFDFDGALRPLRSAFVDRLLSPELPFSAHPRIDPTTGELHNFGTLAGAKNRLVLYRVDASGRMRERRFIPLDALPFVHDFVLTERYAIFFLPPVSFDVPRTLFGLKSPVESISHDRGKPTTVLVVPRDGSEPQRFETRGGFVFHFANGYDDGDRIVIDGARMDRFEGGPILVRDPEWLRGQPSFDARPTRFEIDLARGQVTETDLGSPEIELPTIDSRHSTRAHSVYFAIARSKPSTQMPVHDAIARVRPDARDVVMRSFSPDLPGEPIFVPRSASAPEGDGYLLVLVYRARDKQSALVCLDAATLETIAEATLPHAVPPGFHGCFVQRT
jgi:all-trans-8'-apo-beta-carotenal 15,15'-oxygenase